MYIPCRSLVRVLGVFAFLCPAVAWPQNYYVLEAICEISSVRIHTPTTTGIGVVVDDGTLIATCTSVVGDNAFVEIESAGISQRGYVLDVDRDLAIVLVKDKLKPAAPFKGKVTNGQFILAAGRLETDTRMDMKIGHVEGLKPAGMEIVAEVTNKHVGGPILSEGGYLMGIVKDPANLSEDGSTLAIPSSQILHFIQRIRRDLPR